MIYKNGQLVTSISQAILDKGKVAKKAIGKVYLGTKLVWITIYDAIRSCYGSGTWDWRQKLD